ncbi:MAG: electron transport complex subunit RsxG, partial [Pseudomonadota bacterium]|nr:electron transport complex subunit RsxG [Pseudomonadota bacterium]
LGGFAILCAGAVGFIYDSTRVQIEDNERAARVAALHELIPPKLHDNDLYIDAITAESHNWLGSKKAVPVYRARMGGEPIAVIIAAEAPDGYSGTIKLLVAIRYNGELAGVRVVSHRETPGLGDYIEVQRSSWIRQFDGRSLTNPDEKQWQVKKDGGAFDSNTGATISPRAVVKAVHHALTYYNSHRDQLFAPATPPQSPAKNPAESAPHE